ncbi:ABC transporter ATP-binding protein [Dehalogenimonas etheniformans]|uniref:ABC transporter ATP-binding protein n=1 Tax=Dehalogenimonas etheniformans TaxID=1536648 RepID=A0A2P5P8T2_9CHLR|nr:ABC transporter ATP-binding protein [Dehalogenimonas etheniformans]PPD58699.1 ABC transporter ATP-binding protein [Dehalogenimonas etheniformans]QNT76534.1 ABC transporter ATP-binding protein [Dehalogenimonas etheniformans]
MALLEVKHLVTEFHTQDGIVHAVNDVSFTVDRGELVALVGESGCGKTVSSLSVMRLIPEPAGKIASGDIFFDGVDILRLSKEEMRKIRGCKISMIFQEPMTSLNPVLTIGRQLTESLMLHKELKKKAALAEAANLLQKVGIPQAEKRAKSYPHHFSGGMRQRVMIAMAISCQPKLIIADEPTTAVDVTIQAQLLELLKGIVKDLDSALILITHNLGVVARYAHRVYVMYAGRVVENGTAVEIFHNPLHPYTVGLLGSVPRLDEPRKMRLRSIEGQPPDLICPPSGCAFAARCSYFVKGECDVMKFKMVEMTPGHFTSCLVAINGEMPWQKTKS